MTLDELIDWVDDAMARLPLKGEARDRVKHVRRIYGLLDRQGVEWDLRDEWHALAVKLANLLKLPAPKKPKDPSSTPRERTPSQPPESKPRPRKEPVKRPPPLPAGRRRLAKKPAREPIEINARLQAAFDAVAAGRPIVFVTGGAGTGKSTFIRELRARNPDKNSIVLAPTGVAALNAGGQTIHSFCRLPLRPVMPQDVHKAKEPEIIEALQLLIIDEISMVRADVLDGVDAFLRANRKSELPFGGVQIVLVGDLFQLPPVVTLRDADLITQRYETPHFFAAHCLRGLKFFPIELEIVYRQRDASFASLLACIRDGVNPGDAVRRLNEHCVGRSLDGQHLILVPTREAAAAENDARLAALSGKPRTYEARCEGTFAKAPDDRLPAPRQLVLKPSAQVMFVRNDSERRWVNGTIGVVSSLHNGKVCVRLDDGTSLDVEPIEWQEIHYALDEKTKKIVEEVAGTYVQLPLMPAWSVTIHKAQGLTLARVVVDLARGAFAEGQVYVALSRCQTMEGLSLRRAVRTTEIRCSEAARGFYEKIRVRARR